MPNAEAAQRWYEKAIDGGYAEARSRLEKLLKPDTGHIANIASK